MAEHTQVVAAAAGLALASLLILTLATSQSDAQSSTIVFAAFGDFGEDDQDHTEVAAMVDTWNPDFILSLGDNRYGNTTFDDVIGKRWCDYLSGVQPGPNCNGGNSATSRFYPTTGNHDYNDAGGIAEYDAYFGITGVRYYDFIEGPVHVFALDDRGNGAIDTAQQIWVRDGLRNSTAPFQVVAFHHTPYSSSSQHGSRPVTQLDFANWGADVVLAGHDHTYERLNRDGIIYFVSGLGARNPYGFGPPIAGSQATYNADHGAMLITASPTQMTFEFHSIASNGGGLIDTAIIQATTGPVTAPPPSSSVVLHQGSSGMPGTNESLDLFGSTIAWGDFNGDGFDDLAVATVEEDIGGANNTGAVTILSGSATGLTTAGAQVFHQNTPGVPGGNETNDGFGSALASGDFNGDGRDDLAISTADEDLGGATNTGAVTVLSGSVTGLTTTGAKVFHQGSAAMPGTNEADDRFGSALATGDFDGDGHDDLVISTEGEDIGSADNTGAVTVLQGSSTGLSASDAQVFHQNTPGVPGGNESGDGFGSVLVTGDFDGNGSDDLVLGAPNENIGSIADTGAVTILFGTTGGLSSSGAQAFHQGTVGMPGTNETSDRFANDLAAGDFNADGRDDLAIGTRAEDIGSIVDTGSITVLTGTASGLTTSGAKAFHQGSSGMPGVNEVSDHFGSSMTAADFDGDGTVDLAVAAPGEDIGTVADAGVVTVLSGSAAGLTTTQAQPLQQNTLGIPGVNEDADGFGSALAGADFDGDGSDDLVVSTMFEAIGPVVNTGALTIIAW